MSAFKETSCLIAELDKNRLFAEGNKTKVSIFGAIDLLNWNKVISS